MERIQFTIRYMLILLLMLFVAVWETKAQEINSLASVYSGMEKEVGSSVYRIPLAQVLDNLEEQYRVTFLYQDRVMQDQYVEILESDLNKMTGKQLSEILTALGLNYSQLNEYTFVISRSEIPLTVMQETITGTVTDATTGEALPGVNITIQGTDQGTATDINGEYELTVPSLDETLVFSYIGYTRLEVSMDGRSTINASMEMETFEGEGIVVVGYGTQRKETLSGSISSVSGRELERTPVTNISNALAGQLPGIVSINTSGEPGYDDADINIRGVHTLGNNDPLVVIDGVPGRAGGLARLSSRDIQSVTILKDASAAIYGSRAANGVILITTKRGQVGQPQFNLDINQGFNQPTRIPEMASAGQYVEMLNELDIYRDRPLSYTQEEVQAHYNCADPWLNPCTDWFDEALKSTSYQREANLSVSGGSETIRYFLSFGGLSEDGYYENSATKYNQYDFRTNLDGKLSDNITLSLDITGRLEDRNFPTVGAGPTFRMLMRGKPHLPAYWPNGLPGPDIENGQNPVVTGTEETGYQNDERYFFQSNLRMQVEVPGVDGLSFTGNFAFDKMFRNDKFWSTPWTLYTWDYSSYDDQGNPILTGAQRGPTEPQLNQYDETSQDIMVNLTGNYQQDLENHSYSVLLGVEQQRFQGSNFSGFRRNFISNQVDQLFAGGEALREVSGSAYEGARMNFFSRLNYAYQDKYLLEFIGRYDGSYIFPEGERFGFFPAVSAAWRITQEPWFRDVTTFFDELKFRVSWGQTGNDRFDPDNPRNDEWFFMDTFGFGGGVVFDHENVSSIYQQRVPNPNITWEVANQFDVGVEATFFNDHISTELDYFNYQRTDILHYRNASVPQSAGFSLPRENIGEVSSYGFDGSITWRDQFSQNFLIDVTMNIGYADNEIVFWDETPGVDSWQQSTGAPIGAGLFYDAIGVFETQEDVDNYPHWDGARSGDIIFRDVNEDGIISADDRIRMDKTGTPKWNGGVSISMGYKSFDFIALLQGAAGAVQYIQTESGDFGNYFKEFADERWQPDPNDPSGMAPHPDYPNEGPRAFQRTEEYWIANANTYFLRKTDYIRLKQLEVGYTLPASLTSRLGIENLRLYANGFNLLTWDNFGLMDPEARNQAGHYYPQKRVVNVGLSLSF